MQYRESLPLEDKEVVLTFDDGPIPPRTTAVLDILAANCVKATFFIVGQMAKAHPDTLKRVYAEGHTIGTHTQTHPMRFSRLSDEKAQQEIETGISSTVAALNDPAAVAPFVRIPGLGRTDAIEDYLKSRSLMTWSADFPADDWRSISGKTVTQRALERLDAKGRGILLLHDIHERTVDALPGLLRELKARGYRIVHVVPATPDRPKTPTEAAQWVPPRGTPIAATTKADRPPVPTLTHRRGARTVALRHKPHARWIHQAHHETGRHATW